MKNNKKTKGKKAIVLLSGGLDSATLLALVHRDDYHIIALSFFYGQRHHHELNCAKKLAQFYNVSEHCTMSLPLDTIGGSALTDDSIDVPSSFDATPSAIPITYVPARNTIFLALALSLAEIRHANSIFIGANHIDYSGYPDCRPSYFESWQKLANLATKAGVEATAQGEPPPILIKTPLLSMDKASIIQKGLQLGVDYAMTSSCYAPTPEGFGCEKCESCHIRTTAFRSCGMRDPALSPSPRA